MNILIADDHDIVRKGVIALLRTEFLNVEIAEAANGQEALQEALSRDWDLVILDISMPQLTGIQALKEIRSAGIKTPVLMLSMQPEDQYAIRAMKLGASGFVNKETARAELLIAARKVLAGEKYFSPAITKMFSIHTDTSGPSKALLSDREIQVLELIGSGKTITEIAEQIHLSITTVSTYRARILEKLSLSNNSELTRYALENGIV